MLNAMQLAGWAALVVALSASAPAIAQSSTGTVADKTNFQPIPAAAFYRRPDINRVVLSPPGRWLALTVAGSNDRNLLVTLDLHGSGGLQAVAGFSDRDINGVHWVNDERLVFDFADHAAGSGEWRGPGLFSVARDGKDMKGLVRLELSASVSRSSRLDDMYVLPYNHSLLHVPVASGNEVVVGEWKFDSQSTLEAVLPRRLDVVSGRSRPIATNAPAFVRSWWFDAAGEPRVATSDRNGRARIYWRAPGQDAWRELADFEMFKEAWWPHSLDSQGQLWVTSNAGPAGEAVLKRYDFASGQPHPDPIVSTPGFDFAGRLVSETTGGRTLGVRLETDAEDTVWFDERLRKVQKTVDKKLSGRINRLICARCDHDDMTVLVTSFSDREPGEYWVYRPATEKFHFVGKRRKDIVATRMGRTEFQRIKARDGRDLPVWITRPAGSVAGTPLPTVVLVHGGPWVRGRYWRWDDDVQFLTSRGYLVVEPEFRGSTGYGEVHFRAGWRQWGQAMQDDVADALVWAIKVGHTDAKRACIAGASYGGYAALMGLVMHPELYRCGVAWVAVTDPMLMFTARRSDVPEQVKRHGLPTLLGHPERDAAMLSANSPLAQAGRIKAPVLLAMGEADQRVPLEHGVRMRDALKAAGNAPEWVLYPLEGHGWGLFETRLDFAARMERFLAVHLR